MSTWKPDSDFNRLNAAPEQQWLAVPDELATVLSTALRISRQSGGAFDIAVGDLVNAWGFGPGEQTSRNSKSTRQQPRGARSPVPHWRWIRNAIRCANAVRLTLDLSGIAKGFGVDELARCLDGWGIANYLVGIDGEMRARGVKPGASHGSSRLKNRSRGMREVMGVMEIGDAAIATSGDYRHWVDVAGERYAHTMHPATGAPLCNPLAAVTVVASNCMLADAWATALMVLGEIEARDWRKNAAWMPCSCCATVSSSRKYRLSAANGRRRLKRAEAAGRSPAPCIDPSPDSESPQR